MFTRGGQIKEKADKGKSYSRLLNKEDHKTLQEWETCAQGPHIQSPATVFLVKAKEYTLSGPIMNDWLNVYRFKIDLWFGIEALYKDAWVQAVQIYLVHTVKG